ncbi:hypothetical protein D3C77_663760 [compost metagenome]
MSRRHDVPGNPEAGRVDVLLFDATCFVAARRHVGAGALMRRLGIGRLRAGDLLQALVAKGVLYPWPWRGVYRCAPGAWPWLMVAVRDPWAPCRPAGPDGLAGYRPYPARGVA